MPKQQAGSVVKRSAATRASASTTSGGERRYQGGFETQTAAQR